MKPYTIYWDFGCLASYSSLGRARDSVHDRRQGSATIHGPEGYRDRVERPESPGPVVSTERETNCRRCGLFKPCVDGKCENCRRI